MYTVHGHHFKYVEAGNTATIFHNTDWGLALFADTGGDVARCPVVFSGDTAAWLVPKELRQRGLLAHQMRMERALGDFARAYVAPHAEPEGAPPNPANRSCSMYQHGAKFRSTLSFPIDGASTELTGVDHGTGYVAPGWNSPHVLVCDGRFVGPTTQRYIGDAMAVNAVRKRTIAALKPMRDGLARRNTLTKLGLVDRHADEALADDLKDLPPPDHETYLDFFSTERGLWVAGALVGGEADGAVGVGTVLCKAMEKLRADPLPWRSSRPRAFDVLVLLGVIRMQETKDHDALLQLYYE